jgi:hypothetical protein
VVALTVIGTGFPRTGTLSLKLALDQLGFGPCFHGSELLVRPERFSIWMRAGEGDADWDAIFEGYRSTTDAPACYFWRELGARYAEAKVIHTVRDPESWFESTQATVFGPNSPATNPPPEAKPFFDMLANQGGGERLNDRSFMLDWFRRHTEEVAATIPAARLLVFNLTEGWGPLCAFLGAPIPATPFPRVNQREPLAAWLAEQRIPGDGTTKPA